MQLAWSADDLAFRDEVRAFLAAELTPELKLATAGMTSVYAPPDVALAWQKKLHERGWVAPSWPVDAGGCDWSVAKRYIFARETTEAGAPPLSPMGLGMCGPVLLHYGTEEQKRRWLPKICSGELVTAIAMTEPGAGSDLQNIKTTAKKDGNGYVINGSKTFISNGQTANLILVCAKTDPTKGAKGISIVCVETDEVEGEGGFRRGRNLDKVGQHAADTSELFFDDVKVPASALLGEEAGQGFIQLMQKLPQERHIIGLQGIGMIERAIKETVAYVKSRKAFGGTIWDFQNTQFKLAEAKTEATVAKVFMDHCTELLLQDKLDAATASMSKYWVSDLQCKIIDECLQLHGGFGYMDEYPIAQMYADARVQRIYGGANEVMKMLIARTL